MERTSWHSVDCERQLAAGHQAEADAILTAQAIQCSSVTRATAAKPMPVDSHSTFSRRGTASMRAIAAMSCRAMAAVTGGLESEAGEGRIRGRVASSLSSSGQTARIDPSGNRSARPFAARRAQNADENGPRWISPATQRYLPWIVATALFMEQLDSTIVNTGIPAMAASLGVTPLSLKAVVTSYILSLAVSIPVSGWLAERFGSRRIFLFALGLFTVSSVLCGLAPNASLLVAARVPQGVAAAMMMPVGRSAVVRTFPKSDLLRVMNFIIIPALIGPLLGPTVGGLIVHWLSWRDIFFVNVPVGLAALWLGHKYMPDYRTETPPPLDVVGLVLFGSGVALLSWLLEVFGEHSVPALQMAVLFVLSAALLLAYGWHATQVPFPLLRLGVFKVRTFRISVLGRLERPTAAPILR